MLETGTRGPRTRMTLYALRLVPPLPHAACTHQFDGRQCNKKVQEVCLRRRLCRMRVFDNVSSLDLRLALEIVWLGRLAVGAALCLQDMGGGGNWFCERCNKPVETPQKRYILSCTVNDHTGATWVTCFNETAWGAGTLYLGTDI